MALLTLGLRFSTYVTVYFLMSTLSADVVCAFKRVPRLEESTVINPDSVKTTSDKMYSLKIYVGEHAKKHCGKYTNDITLYDAYFYAELFYKDSHLDSFCSYYNDIRLHPSVMHYCHMVSAEVNVHVFHLDYWLRFDSNCLTVRYSLDPKPSPTESVSCSDARAYQIKRECLKFNGWSSFQVLKALKFSMWKNPADNYPMGIKGWRP